MIRFNSAYISLGLRLAVVAVSQLLIKSRFEQLRVGELIDRYEFFSAAKIILADAGCWGIGLLIVIGAALWYLSIARLPLHFVLPLSALIAPSVSIGAYIFLKEQLSMSKMAAIVMIAAGAAWLGALQ